MFRFTIRDLLWLMVVVGLLLMLLPQIQQRREAESRVDAMKRLEQARRMATKADYDALPYGRAVTENESALPNP